MILKFESKFILLQTQNLAYSSSGQDSRFSSLQQEFDSPIGYLPKQKALCSEGFFVSFTLLVDSWYKVFFKLNFPKFAFLLISTL